MPGSKRKNPSVFPDFSGHILDDGRIHLLHAIGVGSYGKVYKAVDIDSPEKRRVFYAVKCLLRPKEGSRQERVQKRELAIHEQVGRHPNIIGFHRFFLGKHYIFIVLDLCTDGDLFGAITDHKIFRYNDTLVKSVFLQLIDAVKHCHEHAVYHRDLKPENILCRIKDGDVHIFLTDFGLSTCYPLSTNFGCGSSFYMSPDCIGEDLLLDRYSTAHADIWALGVILVNLVTGRNPWRRAVRTDPCFSLFLNDESFLRTILPFSSSAEGILKRIFTINPLSRISLVNLRNEILAIDTFYMSRNELLAASPNCQAIARHYAAKIPAEEIIRLLHDSPAIEHQETRLGSDETFWYPSPADGIDPFPSPHSVHPAIEDIYVSGGGSNVASLPSLPESEGSTDIPSDDNPNANDGQGDTRRLRRVRGFHSLSNASELVEKLDEYFSNSENKLERSWDTFEQLAVPIQYTKKDGSLSPIKKAVRKLQGVLLGTTSSS